MTTVRFAEDAPLVFALAGSVRPAPRRGPDAASPVVTALPPARRAAAPDHDARRRRVAELQRQFAALEQRVHENERRQLLRLELAEAEAQLNRLREARLARGEGGYAILGGPVTETHRRLNALGAPAFREFAQRWRRLSEDDCRVCFRALRLFEGAVAWDPDQGRWAIFACPTGELTHDLGVLAHEAAHVVSGVAKRDTPAPWIIRAGDEVDEGALLALIRERAASDPAAYRAAEDDANRRAASLLGRFGS